MPNFFLKIAFATLSLTPSPINAGGYLYGKQLFTWLSLVVSLMASFVLSFFPLDVLDEIWDLIESVSEGVLTYSCSRCCHTQYLCEVISNWIINEVAKAMIKGEHTYIRTYIHSTGQTLYPSTTPFCEGLISI